MVIKCSRDESLKTMPGRNLWMTSTAGWIRIMPDFYHSSDRRRQPFAHVQPPRTRANRWPKAPACCSPGRWRFAWDEPAGSGLQLATSTDLKTWKHEKNAKFPPRAQHGTLFLAPELRRRLDQEMIIPSMDFSTPASSAMNSGPPHSTRPSAGTTSTERKRLTTSSLPSAKNLRQFPARQARRFARQPEKTGENRDRYGGGIAWTSESSLPTTVTRCPEQRWSENPAARAPSGMPAPPPPRSLSPRSRKDPDR